MAIDTEQKRKSAGTVGAVWLPPSVVPSGSIDQEDRQQIGWGYSGIAAADISIFIPIIVRHLQQQGIS